MTDQKSWFTNMRRIELGTWPVTMANNQQLWVHGVEAIEGMCLVKGRWYKHTMGNVLYIPLLKKNLFSVGQQLTRGLQPYTQETIVFLLLKKERGKSS
jgi:hypothetical protein